MLKISLFGPTVKICNHSLYTQIIMKNFLLFFILVQETKMSSLSTKEKKVKFNTDDLIFRKKSNLSSYFDIEYSSAESLTN